MLTGMEPTDTVETGEISGTNPELIDSELLSSAARIAAEAAIDFLASRNPDDWIVLLRALAELTQTHAEAGDPQPRFSVSALREKCADLDAANRFYWLSEEDTGRKKFGKAWDKLVEAFPGLEANLRQRAERHDVTARVFPFTRFDELDKRSKLFGFELIAIDLPRNRVGGTGAATNSRMESRAPEIGGIKPIEYIDYIEEMEVYPIPGIRQPLRINVQGWRSLMLVAPPVLIAGICTFGLWVVVELLISEMPIRQIFRGTLSVGILGCLLAWLAWPLYRLLEDQIIEAPSLLQLRFIHQHVVLIKKEAQGKVVRMVRFTATCPLCGGLVEIHKGRRSFRGRFIGQCGQNPLEHIFSFDHVLRRGHWLRS